LPTGSAVALSATLDSGVLSGAGARYIRLKYTNNGVAVTGDSVRVRYTSACGVGANKALKLTNLAKVCLVGAPVYAKGANGADVKKFEVYPNPNNGSFTIYFESGVLISKNIVIEIFDVVGKRVDQVLAKMENGKIEVHYNGGKLNPGVYILTFKNVNDFDLKRIIVVQ
jgi:hypothetical protein